MVMGWVAQGIRNNKKITNIQSFLCVLSHEYTLLKHGICYSYVHFLNS